MCSGNMVDFASLKHAYSDFFINKPEKSVGNMADTPCDKVFKLEDILKDKNNETNQDDGNKVVKKKKKVRKNITQGMRKSGRFWKNDRNKSSNLIKTRGIKQANAFEKLKKLKEEINRMKALTKNIVDARNEEIEKKKERRRKNLKRQEENRLKSEIVQVIKNPMKIKKMKRKHLRALEKRDTLFLK